MLSSSCFSLLYSATPIRLQASRLETNINQFQGHIHHAKFFKVLICYFAYLLEGYNFQVSSSVFDASSDFGFFFSNQNRFWSEEEEEEE